MFSYSVTVRKARHVRGVGAVAGWRVSIADIANSLVLHHDDYKMVEV